MITKGMLSFVLIPAAVVTGAVRSLPIEPATPAATAAVSHAAAAPIQYLVAPTGNEARFRAREVLMGQQLPNNAVGTTSKVTGMVVVGDDGQPIATLSKIVVDVNDLKTDVTMRDGFIKRNTLQTAEYPNVVFVPTSFRNFSGPVPTSGTRTFDMVGNLTIRNETRLILWHVTAEFRPGRVTGSAATRFNFEDFNMTPPKAGRVFAVSSGINLEYDFNLVSAAGPT